MWNFQQPRLIEKLFLPDIVEVRSRGLSPSCGLHNFCTYCIVLYPIPAAGTSRDMESILNDVKDLEAKGFKR